MEPPKAHYNKNLSIVSQALFQYISIFAEFIDKQTIRKRKENKRTYSQPDGIEILIIERRLYLNAF